MLCGYRKDVGRLKYARESGEGMPETTNTEVDLDTDVQTDTDVQVDDAAATQALDTGASAASTADDFLSIREAAQQYGYADAANFDDDEAALKHLIEQAKAPRADEQLSLAGRRYLEHSSEFEEFLRTREAEQAAAKTTDEPKFWDAPEWNPAWLNQVQSDPETGQLRPINGGTMETVHRVNRYLAYRGDQQERFWSDPFGYLNPYLEHREKGVESKIKSVVDEALAGERSAMQARQFVSGNQDWLYEKDAQGNPRLAQSADGNVVPVLSADGQRFAGYVNDLNGLPPDVQQEYAMRLLELDRLKSGTATTDDKRTDANKRILQTAAGKTQQTTGTAAAPPAVEEDVVETRQPDLQAMLRNALRESGVTDESIEREMLVGV
jgi:hypothetical protein